MKRLSQQLPPKHDVRSHVQKNFLLVFIILSVGGLIALAGFLMERRFYFRVFNYSPVIGESPIAAKVPKVIVDPSKLQSRVQAKAVPIIYYHGVLDDGMPDDVNTTRSQFLSQMVALKREGYYTIDTQEMIDFYSGKKVLYGKPIMISFDDGRVDSYRPTDDILRQIGFKAVFFIVSGKQDNHTDKFFMSWKQLQVAQASGRWDIQAHGWYSHTKIPIDAKGTMGNPLTNRKWLADKGRLENADEATARITNDYLQNIKDLETHFPGHPITTFAMPYGDYGQKDNNFANYDAAKALSYSICQQYFKMCMLVDNQGYNFAQHDPLRTYRLGVDPSWDDGLLIKYLRFGQPVSPSFTVDFASGQHMGEKVRVLGTEHLTSDGDVLSSRPGEGYVNYDIGANTAYNYRFEATYTLQKGTSFYLSGYKFANAAMSQNVLFGVTADVAYAKITKNGQTTDLASRVLPAFNPAVRHTIAIEFLGAHFKGYVDNQLVVETDLPTLENHGTYGFDIYGPQGSTAVIRAVYTSSTK